MMMGENIEAQEREVAAHKPDTRHLLTARLAAVQAVYELMYNEKPIKAVVKEHLSKKARLREEQEKLADPDPALFQTIVFGVDERKLELEALLAAHLQQNGNVEHLLKAILLCGAYEILACQDIDFPIIINDYLNIAHGFYEQGEVKFLNGVLDAIAQVTREK